MLLDLLSTDNYVSFNIEIAKTVGLHAAIYLSEVIRISEKANRKQCFTDDGFVLLDREYIEKRTTIKPKEQLDIDKVLLPLKIITKPKPDSNECLFNAEVLASLIMGKDESLDKGIKNIIIKNSKSQTSKRDYQRDMMKKFITVQNEELKEAYYKWIDGVYANPKGFLSGGAIETFMKVIDNFSDHDLDVALELLSIATVGGYRDATWAVERYKKLHPYQAVNSDREKVKEQAGNITTL